MLPGIKKLDSWAIFSLFFRSCAGNKQTYKNNNSYLKKGFFFTCSVGTSDFDKIS
jgi:hypothetical protein